MKKIPGMNTWQGGQIENNQNKQIEIVAIDSFCHTDMNIKYKDISSLE